ncbi:MAG: SWIM zinc finger domain-containing protein, partial [Chloroflexi bacterium]|nr:SWIM zinc finger domain-containing protein [Chloroflexota bacterium]
RLTAWQNEVEDSGIDEGFDLAAAAVKSGWDSPALQRALHGEASDDDALDAEASWYSNELTQARLNVLERQGRAQEYLNLSRAGGQFERYATMLAKLGRVTEAVAFGKQNLSSPEETLSLARTLSEHGERASAIEVARTGLSLPGDNRATLARWLRGEAAGSGDGKLALEAGVTAFQESLDLEDYLIVESLAGPQWPAIRPSLLERVKTSKSASHKIEVYLHEGMVSEAVKAASEKGSYMGYDLLERVVDAAKESHPEWAIERCRQEAEPIMDEGKSQHYIAAARWLSLARGAYLANGRQVEWQQYLRGLLQKHARKYALVPRLKQLE